MRTSSMIAGSFASLVAVGSVEAGLVAGTVDPFTTASSVSSGASATYVDSAPATVTGGLWGVRTVSTSVSNNTRASSQVSVSGGSMVLSVTQLGAGGASNQKARLSYSSTGSGADFTNFTSLQFDFASTLGGSIGVRVFINGASAYPVQTSISGASGTLTINAIDFGLAASSAAAVPSFEMEFFRSGSSASGSLTITNLVANGAAVPAPGALALLGAAGLVGGSRRRR